MLPCSLNKAKAEDVTGRVENLLEELRMARNEVSTLRNTVAVLKASSFLNKAFVIGTSNIRYQLDTHRLIYVNLCFI